MSGYELSRRWFDWCFENPEKINPTHSALYFFCIEHCNRLGWKDKFGLPTTMTMEAIGVHSYNTYIKALNDIISFGFIILHEKSRNQYSSNIIALSNFNKANSKALDKAFEKHDTKQVKSIDESSSSINKPINNELNISLQNSIEVLQKENELLKSQVEKKKKAKSIKKRVDPLESKKFYEMELSANETGIEVKKYKMFVDLLNGKNDLGRELTEILAIPTQISYLQFTKLLQKSLEKNKKFHDILISMTNVSKYYENKTNLYLTVNDWFNRENIKQ